MTTNQHPSTPPTPSGSPWEAPHIPAPPAPQPPRKSWFARHKFLTVLLVLVLFGVVSQAFGKGGTTPASSDSAAGVSSGSAPTDGAAAPEDKPAGEAKVGQAVRDGQFEFTVTKVQKGVASVGDQYLNQKAQGQYVLVSVTVRNIGDKAQMLADSSQKVRDAKGREFSADTSAAIYLKDNKVFINEINPGNAVKGVLVFDMPKDTAPASIELHDSPFSDGVTVRLA